MNESHFKAADDDRGAVADKLAKAHAEGRLTQAEFDERSRAVWEARSYAELHQLTADLPGSDRSGTGRPATAPPRSAPAPSPSGRPEPEWQSRPLPVQGETAAGPVWRSTPVGDQVPDNRPADNGRRPADARPADARPAPEWQDASGSGGRDEPVDEPAPVWQDAPRGSTSPRDPRSRDARPAGARIGPEAHADQDHDSGYDPNYDSDYDRGTGHGAGSRAGAGAANTGYAPQRRRREPPPVPQKRSRTTVFLTVLTAVWFFASAINLLIWGIINGTSDTSIYPWWLWVAGPLGVVVLTAHLVRFGMRR
ncbi:DUF1707 domain-containing protein [Actinosynnema sp. NPDC059797]